MRERQVYSEIGTSAGSTPDGTEVVGLLLPKANMVDEDDFDEIYMTIPCAKTLLIDLRDAIDAALKHKSGGGE